jgi:hypothetical protein
MRDLIRESGCAGGQGLDLQSHAMGKIFVPQSDSGVSSLSGEKWVGPEEGLTL